MQTINLNNTTETPVYMAAQSQWLFDVAINESFLRARGWARGAVGPKGGGARGKAFAPCIYLFLLPLKYAGEVFNCFILRSTRCACGRVCANILLFLLNIFKIP